MAKADSRNTIATALIGLKVDLKGLTRGFSRARGLTSRLTRGLQRLTGRATRGFLLMTAAAKRFGRVLKSVLLGPLAFVPGPLAALFGIGAAAAGLGISAKRFADFEQGMARVKAITGATGLEFAKLQGLALELGRTTQFSASQAAEAMGFFSVAGFKVNEQLTAMRPTLNLAAAGQLDMGTAADIVAKIMRGMSLDASQLEETVDVLAKAFTTANTDLVQLGEAFKFVGPIGKSTGKGIKELAAAIQVMSDVGIQGGMAGAALRNILLRLQVQPSEVRKALEKMNVKIGDSEGRMRSLADIVDDLNRGLSSMTDIQRGATVAQIGGIRAASALNEILSVGGDRLREYEKRLKDSAGTAARIAAVQMDTLRGSFIRFKSALEGAAITIGKALAPALNSIADALAAASKPLGDFVAGIKPLATEIGINAGNAIRRIGEFMQNNTKIFSKAMTVIADFILLLTNDLPSAADFFRNSFTLAIEGIKATFLGLLRVAKQVLGELAALFIAFGPSIRDAFLFGGGKKGLKEFQRGLALTLDPTRLKAAFGSQDSGAKGGFADVFSRGGGPAAIANIAKTRKKANAVREERKAARESPPEQPSLAPPNAARARMERRFRETFGRAMPRGSLRNEEQIAGVRQRFRKRDFSPSTKENTKANKEQLKSSKKLEKLTEQLLIATKSNKPGAAVFA